MKDLKALIERAIEETLWLRNSHINEREEWLIAAAERLVKTFRSGNKVLIAGNGGSAADSQHFAGELVVRLRSQLNRQALPAIALTVDTSILTATANDFGYDKIFSRQIEALGVAGDIFLGLSTSGASPNILEAFRTAKGKSLNTFGLFGQSPLAESGLCDLPFHVSSGSTMRIQEEHIFLLHLLVELVEVILYNQ